MLPAEKLVEASKGDSVSFENANDVSSFHLRYDVRSVVHNLIEILDWVL